MQQAWEYAFATFRYHKLRTEGPFQNNWYLESASDDEAPAGQSVGAYVQTLAEQGWELFTTSVSGGVFTRSKMVLIFRRPVHNQ